MRRELAGRVYVDHGCVVVCDPAYVDLSDEDRDEIVEGGDAVRLALDREPEDAGPDHLAVAVASGWGDGWYPCWIERAEDGTVARLVVDFLVTDEGARELDRELDRELAIASVDDDVRRAALGGED
jgi:PAS domain-containing protein